MIGKVFRGNIGAIGYFSANEVPVGLKGLQVDGLRPASGGAWLLYVSLRYTISVHIDETLYYTFADVEVSKGCAPHNF